MKHGASRKTQPGRKMALNLKRMMQKVGVRLGISRGSAPLPEELPRFFFIFLLLFGVGMLVISLLGDQGLIAYLRLQTEAENLRDRVMQLEQRRGELEDGIQALRYDPAAIELMARKKLGLVRPGERIFQLPAPSNGP